MEDPIIAQTIAGQLGRAALALLGAHTFVDLVDGLQFGIRGSQTINRIEIVLDPSDTYTVHFAKVEAERQQKNGLSFTQLTVSRVKSVSDVYCDMLHDIIEEETGLLTRFSN